MSSCYVTIFNAIFTWRRRVGLNEGIGRDFYTLLYMTQHLWGKGIPHTRCFSLLLILLLLFLLLLLILLLFLHYYWYFLLALLVCQGIYMCQVVSNDIWYLQICFSEDLSLEFIRKTYQLFYVVFFLNTIGISYFFAFHMNHSYSDKLSDIHIAWKRTLIFMSRLLV